MVKVAAKAIRTIIPTGRTVVPSDASRAANVHRLERAARKEA
jgi:hypothetical protein